MTNTPSTQLMVYGVTGYTGEMVAREAVRRGLNPVLAGRNEQKVGALARELGVEHRAFDVADAAGHLQDVAVVLNCAGPFHRTAPQMVEACLATNTHYADITGEIGILKHCWEQDARAKEAGVVLVPGTGFDVVPTDSLAAATAARLPDAESLDLAFAMDGRASQGTVRTMIDGLGEGGAVRRDGKVKPVPAAYRMRYIDFPGRGAYGVSIPWGDVFTAGISTGVPNGMVFMATPRPVAWFQKLTAPAVGLLKHPAVARFLNRLVDRLPAGATEEEMRTQGARVWSEARTADGKKVVGRMTTPHPYWLTVQTAVGIAEHLLAGPEAAGYKTPSLLMGADWFLDREDVAVEFEEIDAVPEGASAAE